MSKYGWGLSISKRQGVSSLNTRFDTIVVGGGPAGSAAAHTIAAGGMSVAVVDRAVFPRDKPCGGLLSERSERIFKGIFGQAWGPAIETTANGVVFYHGDRLLSRLDYYGRVYFTSRSHYDTYLLELAAKRGARILQNAAVSSIDPQNCAVFLANHPPLRADFIIGADGVNSRIPKQINCSNRSRRALALGLEIELPRGLLKRPVEAPEIYFGIVKWGYAWVFPKKNSITIGIAGLLKDNRDLKPHFEQFLRQICGYVPNIEFKGHPIPFGSYLRIPGHRSVLLAGDAAGLVEPVTGEGIAFAMLSGRYAAEAVLQAASGGDPNAALGFYLPEYHRITDLLRQAKWMRYLLFPSISEKLFVRVLPGSQTVIKKYMDLLAGKIDYTDYFSFIAKKFVKNPFALVKMIQGL